MTISQEAFFIGAGATALITSMIADRKQRNVAAWAILGFFFGLVALLVCAVLPARRTA